ncbi:hypothetical protein L3V65_00560 [Heyndrickxia coagulans]|nr:hypothetical protein L3V65_00560 [Heyndrickxia coagulans]
MWNPTLAVIVFQHESIEKLCRKLSHNGQLREVCGFEGQVPPGFKSIFWTPISEI